MVVMTRRQGGGDGTRMARRAAAAALAALLALGAPAPSALAQQTPFAGFKHDANQPIDVSADSLEVRNADQVAIFRGSVDVRQGVVRMTANVLEVSYVGQGGGGGSAVPGGGAIERLRAIGEVIMHNGKESARADRADYDVAAGEILLTGNVLLLQGRNAVRGDRLRIDLASGTARMEGQSRVQVQLDPSKAQ